MKKIRIIVAILITLLPSVTLEYPALAAPIVPTPDQEYRPPTLTQTAANTYEFDLSGEKVQLGGSTREFIPSLKFWRFGDESSVELSLIGGGKVASFSTSGIVGDYVTTANTYFTLSYSAVPVKAGFNELGGIDMKMILKRNPGLNTVTFTYNHQNAEAYLQPPLTAEYTAGWSDEFNCNIAVNETVVTNAETGAILAERPIYVVNSIAFYHPVKAGDYSAFPNGKNYKTGKIGHLYRMKVTDYAGKQTWTDWGFGGGNSQINLTIPADFLASATYPVIIEPVGDTFGYESIGASTDAIRYDFPATGSSTIGSRFTPPAGTVTLFSWYGHHIKGTATIKTKCGIYLSSTSALITNGVTNEITTALANGWHDHTFSTNPDISATEYLLGVGASGAPSFNSYSDFLIAYDSGSSGQGGRQTSSSTTTAYLPATATFTNNDRQYSIYCTYTPSSPPAANYIPKIRFY